MALRGVGRESEAESVRFHRRRVTNAARKSNIFVQQPEVGHFRNPHHVPSLLLGAAVGLWFGYHLLAALVIGSLLASHTLLA